MSFMFGLLIFLQPPIEWSLAFSIVPIKVSLLRQERITTWWVEPQLLVSSLYLVETYATFLAFFVDVTRVLCQLELIIQRVKVTTTPDGRVLDLFFVTDSMWGIFTDS